MKKIIITNKFKGHMVAHKKEFIEPFENLIKEFEMSKEFQRLEDDFCKITFNFNRAIGFNTVINIEVNEKVIYAKRIGREIYSKFVKREELGIKTSKVVFILNKKVSNSPMYVNILSDMYYDLLWKDPLGIGTEAIFNIFHLGLFQKLGYCKNEDVYEWINKQSTEEYYSIIAEILAENNELIDINVMFKGEGRYDIALLEGKNGLELSVMKVEDIMDKFVREI